MFNTIPNFGEMRFVKYCAFCHVRYEVFVAVYIDGYRVEVFLFKWQNMSCRICYWVILCQLRKPGPIRIIIGKFAITHPSIIISRERRLILVSCSIDAALNYLGSQIILTEFLKHKCRLILKLIFI